jgi:hypothetical protein
MNIMLLKKQIEKLKLIVLLFYFREFGILLFQTFILD